MTVSPRPIAPFVRAMGQCIERELQRVRGYGCVTTRDTGSHTDMDASTFRRSAAQLQRSFSEADLASVDTFASLRTLGVAMEEAMLQATDGVNTHRGLLFLLLFLAHAWVRGVSWVQMPEVLAAFSQPLRADYARARQFRSAQWEADGLRDIRFYPLSGFRPLFDWIEQMESQPRLQEDDALTLFLLARVDDTTTVHRSDIATLRYVQQAARQALSAPTDAPAIALDAYYRAHRLSSGGVADLFTTLRLLETLKGDWNATPLD